MDSIQRTVLAIEFKGTKKTRRRKANAEIHTHETSATLLQFSLGVDLLCLQEWIQTNSTGLLVNAVLLFEDQRDYNGDASTTKF